MYHGLGQQRCGGGAVAGDVVGLGGDFAHQLSAHVLKRILKFDFLGDGHAVVGDERRAEFSFENYIAALGAESDLNGIGQLVYAGLESLAGLVVALYELCHNFNYLLYFKKRNSLFHDCEDVALTDDGILDVVYLYLGAGVFAGDDLVAGLDGHFDFLAVDDAAGAYGDDFRDSGLFLGTAGKDKASLGGLLGLGQFNHNTVC
ncbi:hypothetical protein SDC9_167064 [bioreactor metagenome]|uniref:NAD-specific glutamate dehydrogenase n=1 Tax=bioreactor metagenome TaxID=1076179 RepID=A0A645G189_9ZZZZ